MCERVMSKLSSQRPFVLGACGTLAAIAQKRVWGLWIALLPPLQGEDLYGNQPQLGQSEIAEWKRYKTSLEKKKEIFVLKQRSVGD